MKIRSYAQYNSTDSRESIDSNNMRPKVMDGKCLSKLVMVEEKQIIKFYKNNTHLEEEKGGYI